ncbi:MAG: apolipoprotein N-acyltransferase [Balneolaceae bacterium]
MTRIPFWNSLPALALTSSVLLALSFPPFDLGWLQFAAILFLLRLAHIAPTTRLMVGWSYLAFVLWNLFNTYWLMMASVPAGIAAILANAALMVIPLWIARRLMLARSLPPLIVAFLAAAAWVGYEYLHHHWDLAWPWLTLGNAWANLTAVIQYISVTGIWGVSFWVFFTSAVAYQAILSGQRSHGIAAAVLFLLFPLFSVVAMVGIGQYDTGEPMEVVIVQPNSDSYQPYGGHRDVNALITSLLELTGEAVTPQTDLVLWPENAVSSNVQRFGPEVSRIRDSLRVWDTELVTGVGYLRLYGEDEVPAIHRLTTGGDPINVFNAAFHLTGQQPPEVYEKGRLVPVVERFPFVEFFNRLDLFGWVDWGVQAGYGLGREATVFQTAAGNTPALICYDSVFPGWVNEFVNNDADFISIITNDGWWGDSHGHIQHFAYARLRAMEHRMWVARSANNGISGVISPDGKVQKETEYWTRQAFAFTIYKLEPGTFYTRYGDWLGRLLAVAGLFGFGLTVYLNRRRDTENK